MSDAGPALPAFLHVDSSAQGRRWVARCTDERAALAIAQRTGVPDVVARVLAGRDVTVEAAEAFLAPTLRSLLPDPDILVDMQPAVARLVQAVTGGKSVGVFGDYDVDGATSTALIVQYFRALGLEVPFHIPDRIAEGYGPNGPGLIRLARQEVDVVVTVDCGVTAFDALDEAAEAGVEVIVIDHHLAEARLPKAVAVINPNRIDQAPGLGNLAAVGVTFLTLVALNRALRAAGWFGPDRPEPDLRRWLDLVALGTVCDVVPLTGLNRAYVAQGLKVLAQGANPGLAALAEAAGLTAADEVYHLGFVLGPRINAGGRVGQADLGARLLTTADVGEAGRIAADLDALNTQRRSIEQGVADRALAELGLDAGRDEAPATVVWGEDWHPGVIGIVASRLVERFGRPAVVIGVDADGIGKGSGRSVPGIDLGAAVTAARQAGLLIAGGGHPMAAGLTVARDRIEALRDFLCERLAKAAAGRPATVTWPVDGAVSPRGLTAELYDTLLKAGPFGSGHPEPVIAVPQVTVRARIVGEAHVKATLAAPDGGRVDAIAFRSVDTPLGALLLNAGDRPLHVAGRVRLNHWRGERRAELHIEDAAPVL